MNSSERGFTLLGVMVSMLILVTVIVASFTLLAKTQKLVSLSRDTFIATNVAREGIELVRAVRDNNWLQEREWDEDICVDELNDLIVDFNPDLPDEIQLVHDPTPEQTKLHLEENRWSHFPSPESEPTGFSRYLNVDCTNAAAELVDPTDPNRIEVMAHVTWQRDGEEEVLLLGARFYDWQE